MRKKSKQKQSSRTSKRWHAAPLKGSFMVLAIIGFFFSAYLVYPESVNYGIAFMLVFAAMFIASLISMAHAPIRGQEK
ncbi:hypothetical protein HOL21_02055 [Candidatus Woesearchaeota archaeon]|jgi:hypothetical protein|nr:hypothetical protein [Candidatus Woesearchaeota archaeon]MBT5396975.1 hypothetical protein [Candidatus Woesearchaeota archaeon]MBT6367168.1 hypothetical protein [Candidatus Woesearchaeota archaeon]MBT7762258.1 hypothetical protein [Candidatus Woesearchaeota archaeon]